MKVAQRPINSEEAPYIIAELGVNHDGDLDRAMNLVDAAAAARADAIKLQMFEADLLMSSASTLAAYQQKQGEANPIDMLRRLQLNDRALNQLCDHAHNFGLHAIITVFSLELVDRAAALPCDAFKTASPDLINRPLLLALASTSRPLIVSTGASSLEELEQADRWLRGRDVAYLQCVSAYPTPDDSASIGAMREIHHFTKKPVGYSDHTTNTLTGALAVAAGATILEKHLTYDQTAQGPDHAASLNPDQFAKYVRLARLAHQMLGSRAKQVLPIEEDVRRVSRQSITASRTIHRGQKLIRSDLTLKRPGTGIQPDHLEELIGRTASCDIQADHPLQWSDLS